MEKDRVEALRELFSKDRFAAMCGIQIDTIEDGLTRCSMAITEDHKNAMGRPMGCAIFTLADFTCGLLSNSGGKSTVSLESHIAFLGVAKGTKLIAEAKTVKEGHATSFYEVIVTDELGNKVAFMTGSGFVLGN